MENKGVILEKEFLQATPTTLVWDTRSEVQAREGEGDAEDEDDLDVWDELDTASDDDAEAEPKAKRRATSKKSI